MDIIIGLQFSSNLAKGAGGGGDVNWSITQDLGGKIRFLWSKFEYSVLN